MNAACHPTVKLQALLLLLAQKRVLMLAKRSSAWLVRSGAGHHFAIAGESKRYGPEPSRGQRAHLVQVFPLLACQMDKEDPLDRVWLQVPKQIFRIEVRQFAHQQ